jgi:DNA uptake protein ComE-like DNA-binding protein
MFTSLDDLVRVRGIGEATIERLRARVVVGRAAR